MPHESDRPPPAARKGLDLDNLHINSSSSKHTNKKAPTAFPATAQKSTRIKTEHAVLGDPGRTVLEGLAPPTAFQTVVGPTVVPVRETIYKTSKHKSTQPPPAANSGLNLDDIQNVHKQATTSFPATAQKSTRIKTERAPLGDPGRTVLEGLAPPTAFQTVVDPTVVPATQYKRMVPPSRGADYPAHTPSIHSAAPSTTSAAPNWAKSVFTKPEDQKMATRQTAYATLSPAEQAKQNTWAQSMINRSIRCPQGYDWNRNHQNPGPSGYQCAGGHHFVTDNLLAEGKGGVFLVQGGTMEPWWGPYYPDPQNPERLVYGGPQTGHHSTSFGPDWIDPKTQTWHWPKLWQIVEDVKGPPGNEADYPLLEQGLELFFDTPRKIDSKSHGATLILRRKDTVNVPDSPHGWQYRNGGWAPPSGAGSGFSYAGRLRSSSGSGAGSGISYAALLRSPSKSSGAGSGISYAALLRSPSKSHTDDFGLQVISPDSLRRKKDFQRSHSGSESRSPGSPSNSHSSISSSALSSSGPPSNSHSSISSSALSSPGPRHSAPPPYDNDTNAFRAPPSGYHPSNLNRPSSNNLWSSQPNSPWDRHGAGSNNLWSNKSNSPWGRHGAASNNLWSNKPNSPWDRHGADSNNFS
jgi:hypothetical protein